MTTGSEAGSVASAAKLLLGPGTEGGTVADDGSAEAADGFAAVDKVFADLFNG
jgi:hypothetical protein